MYVCGVGAPGPAVLAVASQESHLGLGQTLLQLVALALALQQPLVQFQHVPLQRCQCCQVELRETGGHSVSTHTHTHTEESTASAHTHTHTHTGGHSVSIHTHTQTGGHSVSASDCARGTDASTRTHTHAYIQTHACTHVQINRHKLSSKTKLPK